MCSRILGIGVVAFLEIMHCLLYSTTLPDTLLGIQADDAYSSHIPASSAAVGFIYISFVLVLVSNACYIASLIVHLDTLVIHYSFHAVRTSVQ